MAFLESCLGVVFDLWIEFPAERNTPVLTDEVQILLSEHSHRIELQSQIQHSELLHKIDRVKEDVYAGLEEELVVSKKNDIFEQHWMHFLSQTKTAICDQTWSFRKERCERKIDKIIREKNVKANLYSCFSQAHPYPKIQKVIRKFRRKKQETSFSSHQFYANGYSIEFCTLP